ncbi:MAG: copper uptake system-associated protein [Betaproteobacteria bacterium]|nr:copper uptake system-associated protein [Betaproteobacteria bacterium]NDE53864.1 copper uptake system-associated protein [Actinomycetota bacterium]
MKCNIIFKLLTRMFFSLGAVLFTVSASLISPLAHEQPPRKTTTEHGKASDQQVIESLMKRQFDRPDAPLRVTPVSVEGAFAVAGWIQDGQGGRALFEKQRGQWTIVICAGDALLDPKTLIASGMPSTAAMRLLEKTQIAESKLSEADRGRLSLFRGLMKVDQSAHHGPQGHSQPSKHGH